MGLADEAEAVIIAGGVADVAVEAVTPDVTTTTQLLLRTNELIGMLRRRT